MPEGKTINEQLIDTFFKWKDIKLRQDRNIPIRTIFKDQMIDGKPISEYCKNNKKILTISELEDAHKKTIDTINGRYWINKDTNIVYSAERKNQPAQDRRKRLTKKLDDLMRNNGFFSAGDIDRGFQGLPKGNALQKVEVMKKEHFFKWLENCGTDLSKVSHYLKFDGNVLQQVSKDGKNEIKEVFGDGVLRTILNFVPKSVRRRELVGNDVWMRISTRWFPKQAIEKIFPRSYAAELQQEMFGISMGHLLERYKVEVLGNLYDANMRDDMTGYNENISIVELCKAQAELTLCGPEKTGKREMLKGKLDQLKERLDRKNPAAQTDALKNLLLYTADKFEQGLLWNHLCSQSQSFQRVDNLFNTKISLGVSDLNQDVDEVKYLATAKTALIQAASAANDNSHSDIKNIKRMCSALGYEYADEAVKVLIQAAQQTNKSTSRFYRACQGQDAKEVLKEMVLGDDKSSEHLIRVKNVLKPRSLVNRVKRHLYRKKVASGFREALNRVKSRNSPDSHRNRPQDPGKK